MKKEIVNIKGTRQGLAIMLDTSCDYEEIKITLVEKFKTGNNFFKGAKFAIQTMAQQLNPDQSKELEDICCQYGLIPSGEIRPVVHRDTVLVVNKDSEPTLLKTKPIKKSTALPHQGLTSQEAEIPSITVNHHLRSGQKIHYPGNVVVMGDVNPGAEIIAAGSIIVMGTLRGIAHAGASGDENSFIMAYSLRPTQLRIANTIGRSPDDEPTGAFDFSPEIAKISNGSIMLESYSTHKNNQTCKK